MMPLGHGMAGEIAIRVLRPELRDRSAADRLVLAVLREHADSLLRVRRCTRRAGGHPRA